MEIKSSNPAVQAIVGGTAPRPAQLAAARGMLPLPQADLLEILVALEAGEDAELKSAARETLQGQDADELLTVAAEPETAPAVLGYLARRADLPHKLHETVIVNKAVPDDAVAALAAETSAGALLELIAVNQQRLIRHPAILDAILGNAARTPEAERRARETRTEFFEKERGAQQIADELRAQGKTAAAEFIAAAESFDIDPDFTYDDAILLASHIEVDDADIDDSWLALEIIDELEEETAEERARLVERMLAEAAGEISGEKLSLIRKIMSMKVKDRVKFALKGDREARNILIRDSNRLVTTAVVKNPRITDQEVETISAMRSVPDDVLRVISLNRTWMRLYSIVHNLARNPRTPVAVAMGLLPRLQLGDLNALVKNRNVSEGVRRQAQRLATARKGS